MKGKPTQTADTLLAKGVITRDQYQRSLQHYNQYGGYVEEALLEVNAIDEETLLKFLAQVHHTRFVTTEKLRKADIPREILEKVPVKVATQHMIFPILFDAKNNQISIITMDPTNLAAEEDVKLHAKVARVRLFVARPATIKAAIAKFYKGDIHAFAMIDRQDMEAYQSMMGVYEPNLLDEASMAAALAGTGASSERMISAEEIERKATKAEAQGGPTTSSQINAVIEMMRVMVSLVESNRGDLAGHSVLTGRYTEQMCQRIGLTEHDKSEITLAALLHDLGKGSPYHLTPFNVAEWDGHRTAAEKRFQNPIRLFDTTDLPEVARTALLNMYERFDGKGLPGGTRSKDIPLGARILAIADTFADLTSNPRNPFRRTLSTDEAAEVIDRGKGTVFDPNLVDLFKIVVAGDDIKRQLLTGAQTVLVIDADPEQCAILDLQLTNRGFRVRTSCAADDAVRTLIEHPVHLILSEVDIKPINGFELKQRLNQDERTKDIPLIFFTSHAASAEVETGFQLGAQDYLVKPSTADVLVAKIHKILSQATPDKAGGVSGSLTEMSLPDLVQILSHGRKSGRLSLSSGNSRGEIHFSGGNVCNALFGEHRGEEAFYAMLRLKDGNFALDPHYKPDSHTINMTSEMLLLEGLRRFDEDNR